MRILFLGAGALGGYFGGRMTAGGADVTLLVRPGRKEQMAGKIRIESPLGDAVVPVAAMTAAEVEGPFDVIVLTNKAYGLDGALDTIAPFAAPGTAILPLLNGIAHIDMIAARFPECPVIGGVAHIPAEMRADGSILHRGELARLTIGAFAPGHSQDGVVDGFVTAARAGSVDAVGVDNIAQVLWEKWVMLASLAAGTCLMRGDVGQICRTDHGASVMDALIDECASVATAAGFAPRSQQATFTRSQLLNPEGTFKASMLTDLEAGNPTEADHIIGDMIRRAASQGIETPYLKLALTHLQVYEGRRA